MKRLKEMMRAMSDRSQNRLFLVIAFLINILVFRWFGIISFLVMSGFIQLSRRSKKTSVEKSKEILQVSLGVGIFFFGLILIGSLLEVADISKYISAEMLGAILVAILVGIAILKETKNSN